MRKGDVKRQQVRVRLLLSVFCFAGLHVGCDSDSLFGSGARSSASVTTPAGVQSGDVVLAYTLRGDDGNLVDVDVTYSTNGSVFQQATPGAGGDPTSGLMVSELGESYSFVWDSQSDLPGERLDAVFLRVKPNNGFSDTTDGMELHNSRFMVVADEGVTGFASLYLTNVATGETEFLSGLGTGGNAAHSILLVGDYFLITHTDSGDVAVLALDELNRELSPVLGSPFATDGLEASHVAAADDHVFVLNSGSETITVFDFDGSTGALSLSPHSGVLADGATALARRAGTLYAASEITDEILIFDIGSEGQLLTNAASPFTGGGLDSPIALTQLGTTLYASHRDVSSVSAFTMESSGALTALAGSPFTISGAAVEALAVSGTTIVGVRGSVAAVVSLVTDALGAPSEAVLSPFGLGGPAFAIATAGPIVVVGTTTSEALEIFVVGAAGELTAATGSPFDAGAPVSGIAFSP